MAAEMKATRRVSVRLTKRDFKLAISRQEVALVNRNASQTVAEAGKQTGGERSGIPAPDHPGHQELPSPVRRLRYSSFAAFLWRSEVTDHRARMKETADLRV
jgi:hypothetical protein